MEIHYLNLFVSNISRCFLEISIKWALGMFTSQKYFSFDNSTQRILLNKLSL